MKNLIKYAFAGAVLFGLASCEDDEQNVTDFVQETVERGAVLRTVDLIENSFPIGVEGAQFSVLLEEQDAEGGDLLSSVDVEVVFTDGSPDNGDTTGAIVGERVAVRTIDASEFTDGPFGLPRTTLTLTLEELLPLFNLTTDNLFGGDSFRTFLTLNLTDGRVFNSDNVAGVVTGGFFASPFQYLTPVVCPVPAEFMTGDYLMERTSTQEDPFFPNYGQAFDTQVVTLAGESALREFNFSYFPNSFDFGQILSINLSCGDLIVSGTAAAGTLGCGDGSIGQSQGAVAPSQYDLGDDTVVEMSFEDFNPDAGCGTGSYPVTIRLTKQ